MSQDEFIGREKEMRELERFLDKRSASLIVLEGRRRIGKSRLVEEFARKNKLQFYRFVGLPPERGITAQTQRNEFANQLGLKNVKTENWSDLFNILADKTSNGRLLILLDEVSWMAMDDATFNGKLKNAWDLLFKKNSQLLLILCGSVSSWIDKNILSSAGFVGRISYVLNLKELPLPDCNKFWDGIGGMISPYEKMKVLSVTGGVPRYLEEINPKISAEENIRNLCFKDGALLFKEFDQIFNDIFTNRNIIYKNILTFILEGQYQYEHIYKKLGVQKSGLISEYLTDLEKAGFISRDYTWHIATGKASKLSKYRISDNYIRYYLKYIEPNKEIIKKGAFATRALTSLPGWQSIMGLQFENLVLANRTLIQKTLHIRAEDILYDNPFFQTKTTKQQGCQIDYMIQTRFDTLYICEIKFSKNPISTKIIEEMKEKINRLRLPKRISCRSVLIHVNGVINDLLDTRYFADIIDFGQFLDNG
ncbi:MAG: ATP-binding protein [Gammaproteobacteria bacterium]|jgi:AAA+ ATPase superfamily predicted ATPase